MLDIEVLAHAAEAVADVLPAPASARQRVLFWPDPVARNEDVAAGQRFANAQVTAFEAQMEARRKAAAR